MVGPQRDEPRLHADFVSGHAELAALTGATFYLGAQAGDRLPHVPVRHGDEGRFGNCILRFLETPGHTLESISILSATWDAPTSLPITLRGKV
jgi:glyoxylase-like metal-dependent hydrolase (beta-lactamase superfamily II)